LLGICDEFVASTTAIPAAVMRWLRDMDGRFDGFDDRFDCTDHVFTAVGNAIAAIKYAIIFQSGASLGASKLSATRR